MDKTCNNLDYSQPRPEQSRCSTKLANIVQSLGADPLLVGELASTSGHERHFSVCLRKCERRPGLTLSQLSMTAPAKSWSIIEAGAPKGWMCMVFEVLLAVRSRALISTAVKVICVTQVRWVA